MKQDFSFVYLTKWFIFSQSGELGIAECPLCLAELPVECFPELSTCSHRSCYDCFQQYLRIEISESRVSIACPECCEPMHPNGMYTYNTVWQ
jgi:E3 ubiquitin-protein ligase RNF19A